MRRIVVLILLSCPGFAQFAEFSSTDDGRRLYFTTTLQLAGATTSDPESRIFRFDDSGVKLVAERGSQAITDTFSSGFGAHTPHVSGDGNTLGFFLSGICASVTPCAGGISEAILRTASGDTVLGNSALTLSHDAQWAALTTALGPPPANQPPFSTRINIATGERIPLPGSVAATFPIAADGTVVLQETSGVGLWQLGTFTLLPLRGPYAIFAISDDARLLVYSQLFNFPTSPSNRLIVRDIASGNEKVIVNRSADIGSFGVLGLSKDGQKLLYRATGKTNDGSPFVANTATGETTALPLPFGESVVDGTLSGNGNIAFFLTTTGRLVSMDLANGNALRTLIAPTPYVADFPVLVPGSRVSLRGTLPNSLTALKGHLFLNDLMVPVIVIDNNGVAVQVPWDTTPGRAAFRLDVASDSPFHQNQWVNIAVMFPRFLPLGPGQSSVLGFLAIRQNFSGFITTQPNPGDVIVVYMTGLGPVNGAISTGQPTPLDRKIPISGTFTCHFNPYAADAETLFAGLAPSLIGFYQVNFRLPTEPNPGPITGGSCGYSGPGVSGGFTWTPTSGAF